MNYYVAVLQKYADFTGRARRSEYWWYTLITIIISSGLAVIDEMAGLNKTTNNLSPLSSLYSLAVLIPGLAVLVRRLHDIGKSGWALLIGFIPLIGAIILLLYIVREGDSGKNAYGPNPKARKRVRNDDDDDEDKKRFEFE